MQSEIRLDDTDEETVPRLARKSLAEQAADELRNLILLGKLSPGSTIPERETAAALGVSRTPLREALRILATDGLVEIAPNRAPQVANPSLDEIKELLQVQGALEALAGELATVKATDAAIQAILTQEREMNAMSDKSEPLDFFRRDMAFHTAIVAASENQPLIETHATYNSRLWRARFISSHQRVNRPAALEKHRDIATALVERDGPVVAKALREHLEIGFTNISMARLAVESASDGKKT